MAMMPTLHSAAARASRGRLNPASIAAVNLFLPSNGSFFTDEAGTTPAVNTDPVGRLAAGKPGTPYASVATTSQRPTKTATGLQTVDNTTRLNLSSAVTYAADFMLMFTGTLAATNSKWFPVGGNVLNNSGLLIGYGGLYYFRPNNSAGQLFPSLASMGLSAGNKLMYIRRVAGDVFARGTGMSAEFNMGNAPGDFTIAHITYWPDDPSTSTANRTRSLIGKTNGALDADYLSMKSWCETTDGYLL